MNKSLPLFALIAAYMIAASCEKEAVYDGDGSMTVAFEASGIISVSESDTRSGDVLVASLPAPVPFVSDLPMEEPLFLITSIEDGIATDAGEDDAVETKGALVGSVSSSFTFGVSEYNGNTAVSSFQNVKPTLASGSTAVFNSGKHWEAGAYSGTSYAFHAYSPYLSATANGLTLDSGNKTITYNMSSLAAANQPDLMTAYASTPYVAAVPLTFSHRLCAIRIVLGSNWRSGFSVTSVKFKNIYSKGTVTIQNGSWSESGVTKGDYTVSGINTPTSAGGIVIGETSKYLMMVPQTLSGATMEIVLKDKSNKTYTLSAPIEGTWTAGKTVTYTLNPTGITSLTVTYPVWTPVSGSGNTYGPVGNYTNSDSFGIYAFNSSGTRVLNNVEITVSSVNTSTRVATLSVPTDDFWSKNWTYFIYYPYTSSPGTVPSTLTNSSTNANTFFTNVINGWTVETTQNQTTLANYKKSDLQVGKLSGTAFSMAHAMGLARMNIVNKTAPETITKTFNSTGANPSSTTNSSTNVTLTTSTSLTTATANRLYKDGSNNYWTIVKPSSSTNVTLSSNSGNDAWTLTFSGITSGKYKAADAITARECKNYILNYNYTSDVKTLTVPLTGTYEFFVWGAQGQSTTALTGTNNNGTYRGGYGGYSHGKMTLDKGGKIYILVGQTGGNGTNNYAWPNGGGSGTSSASSVGTGGGASLITDKSGGITISGKTSLQSLADSDILIMAGGGGAACWGQHSGSNYWTGHGGAGGGYQGYAGTTNAYYSTAGKGGTQSAGGAAGGVSGRPAGERLAGGGASSPTCTGGGGGYYGGGSSWGSAGGGGSGYIGNSKLTTDKYMYSYYNSAYTSDSEHTSSGTTTKTYSTTTVSSATPPAQSASARQGNGYIIIKSLL